MDNTEEPSRWRREIHEGTDVDAHGVPIHAFGDGPPPEFFEILGRLLAVNGQIEYLQERLAHLPRSETTGVRKVEQFLARCVSGRDDRNAIVHSRWVFGAHTTDPEVIFGLRYKTRKRTVGPIATVFISDVPDSERAQETVQHTLGSLKKLLRRDITTMRIGELAYTKIMMKWSTKQLAETEVGPPLS